MIGAIKRTVGRKAFVAGATQLVRAGVVIGATVGLDIDDKIAEEIGQQLGLVSYAAMGLAYALWEIAPVVQAWWVRSSDHDPPLQSIERKRRGL